MRCLLAGPSTGWYYAHGNSSLQSHKILLQKTGSLAVEFCLDSFELASPRMTGLLSDKSVSFNAGLVVYRSLHLPDFCVSKEIMTQSSLAQEIVRQRIIHMAVLHPLKDNGQYPYDYYESLIGQGVPLAIENMDAKKDSGHNIVELANLVREFGMGFVLDVQHAYEHDSFMHYAMDLFHLLGESVVHLHVSGQSGGNNHSLLCRSENKARIIDFLGWMLEKKQMAIILEGEYRTAEDLKEEIEFLEKELVSKPVS